MNSYDLINLTEQEESIVLSGIIPAICVSFYCV